jgi:hypothetical protein
MAYKPNYAEYSRPPQGWHDEPFEYVYSFYQVIASPQTASALSFFNTPLQLDPDADFFARGIAILQDPSPGKLFTQITFDMRLRDSFGRYLDNGFVPMGAYATSPTSLDETGFPAGGPVATPWYPELYCPANSAMWADFQAELGVTGVGNAYYSFHIYLQGVKRFQNEDCKPNSTSPSSTKKSSIWFEGTAAA